MTAVVGVSYENGAWDIVIGKVRIESIDIYDLAKKIEEALGEGVKIEVHGSIFAFFVPGDERLYTANAVDPQNLQDTIEAILKSRQALEAQTKSAGGSPSKTITPAAATTPAHAVRQHVTITTDNFPILATRIKTTNNVAESSLKVRLTSKYGLTSGDIFQSIVMESMDRENGF